MKKIIFLCTGNSCRSQMAEGFARYMLRGKKHKINSAGIEPVGLNNLAVQVMKEVGIDISNQKSQPVSDFNLNTFDLVITVCDRAHKSCPVVRHTKKIHKNFFDPALVAGNLKQQIIIYRKVRDEIKAMVSDLLIKYDAICQEQN